MRLLACAAAAVMFTLPFAVAQPPTNAPGANGASGGRGGSGRGGGGQQGPPLPFMILKFDPGLDAVISSDAKLETVVTIPGVNGEGPVWREGRLWFSDQRGGNIYAVTPDGKATVIAEMAGGPINPAFNFSQGPNALAMDKDGSMLVCRQAIRDIGRMKADGTIVEAYARYNGKRFNAPNDLVFAPNGTLWMTDPTFSLPGARGGGEIPADSQYPVQGVYSIRNGKVTLAVSDLTLPNGVGVSPDGKTLYVGTSTQPATIHAYDIGADDTVSNGRNFSDFGIKPGDNIRGFVDSMKVDSKGNVWTTGPGGITIIAPSGKVLGRIQMAQSSNLAFGGADYKDVYFTSGATLYRMHTITPGQKPMYAKP